MSLRAPTSRLAAVALLVSAAAVLGACGSGEPTAGGPAATASVPATQSATTSPGVQPEGFTTVTARITGADGEVCDVCLWLADTADERRRGLMGVTALGDASGMAFAFDEPVTNSFLMFGTPTPLSIAWFGPDGAPVATADMDPCLDAEYDDCPRYRPDLPYDLAIEVFADDRGDALAELGIGPGARVELVPGTEAPACEPV